MLSSDNNFQQYRNLLKTVDPPAVPYLGVHLRDLVFIEDGNVDTLESSDGFVRVNFEKQAFVAKVLRQINHHQATRYIFEACEPIQTYISRKLEKSADANDNELYKQSLAIEPRNGVLPPKKSADKKKKRSGTTSCVDSNELVNLDDRGKMLGVVRDLVASETAHVWERMRSQQQQLSTHAKRIVEVQRLLLDTVEALCQAQEDISQDVFSDLKSKLAAIETSVAALATESEQLSAE